MVFLTIGNPFLIQFNLIKKCPLKCRYCYLRELDNSYLSFKKIKFFLLKFAKWTSKYKFDLHLNLTGGDLWLHPEIEKICNFVHSQKFISKVSLLINDLQYKKAKRIILSLKDKIDVVQPNIEIINKRKKDISFLQKNNIKTVIKIMLSKNSNIERQIKIATSLKRIYAKLFISIDRFCPLNNKDYKYVLSTTSLLKIIRKIRLIFGSSFITNDPIARTMFYLDNNDERHKNKKITHSSDCIYGCIIPNGGFAIYPDGTIKLCSRIGGFDTGFDINNFNLVEYLRKFKYIQYLKKNNCGDCQLFNLCAGGCIGTSYAKNNLIDKDTHCLKSITI